MKMYSVKFIPPQDGNYIGQFLKSGFESRGQAYEWIVDNHCCEDCKVLYRTKFQTDIHCLKNWDVFATAQSINLKELPDFSIQFAKLFVESLKLAGVTEVQIQSALRDMYEISCINCRDITSDTSKYWARIGWVIEKILV